MSDSENYSLLLDKKFPHINRSYIKFHNIFIKIYRYEMIHKKWIWGQVKKNKTKKLPVADEINTRLVT